MSEKIDMIYDLLKQDREDASDFRKEVRDSHKSTGERLGVLESQGQVQNEQIKEHISGVDTLKKLHQDNVDRIQENKDSIEVLEKPTIVFSTLKKWFIGVGAIAAAAVAISKAFGLF